jgi:hypothetical protein
MNITKKLAKNYLISIGYNVKGITNIEYFTDIYNIITAYGIRFNIKNDMDWILVNKYDIEKYIKLQLRKNKLESLD